MPEYEWKNEKTGEITTTAHWSVPPDDSGNWKRLWTFGIGRVEGGGGTPGRTSLRGS